ncbi:MAG: hypothetical protein NVS3B19_02500 [Ginsengibacter sp.]
MYQLKQLESASSLISRYKGNEPLHTFLKKHFSENKKYGSTDRKNITNFCYAYFRLGKLSFAANTEERILTSLLMSNPVNKKLLEVLKPDWIPLFDRAITEKISFANIDNLATGIFPFCEMLSKEINCIKYNFSFLTQPDLFARIRPGMKSVVLQKLYLSKIDYEVIDDLSIRFPANTNLDNIFNVGKEVIIQDFNSQRIRFFMQPLLRSNEEIPLEVWDACAASGGKSILAYDLNNTIKLNVSDIRDNILQNLNTRFSTASIKNYNSFTVDLSDPEISNRSLKEGIKLKLFDFVVADVPCTGSGTWARTPENLYYFNPKQVLKYSDLQKNIIDKTVKHVRPGGHFLYITCSVFNAENESQVEYILKNKELKLEKMEMLKGYEQNADSLFAALFIAS